MSSSQPESGSNGGLSPYVQMLLSFGAIPKWHNVLSLLSIWLITTGFIVIPSSLVSFSSADIFSINGPSQLKEVLSLKLNASLFAIGISKVFVGLIGMWVLSHYRSPNHMPLKDNYFWLYNQYYLRVAEGGIYGMTLLVVIIVELRHCYIDRPTLAAIGVTGSIKVLYCGLAIWSYFKMRGARKAYKSQPQAEKPQTEDPYVKMLLDSVLLPGWHILLSTFFIFLITLAFITTPSSLVKIAEADKHYDNILIEQITLSEPWLGGGVSTFLIGFIGMFLLSRFRYLKNNYFWLYYQYYLPMVQGGIFGVISVLVSIFVLRRHYGHDVMDGPTIVVIGVTCSVTALFGGLAGRSYFKMRRVMKAHGTPQPQAEVDRFSGSP